LAKIREVIFLATQEKQVTAMVQEMKVFDVPRRIREALEGLEKEFKDYRIGDIKVGVEAGIPAGFKGSVQVTLIKK
jgi:hypothetical protein